MIFRQTPDPKTPGSRSCRFCSLRALPGSDRCGRHQNTNARAAEQPYRRHYSSAEYRRNKARRYKAAGGTCERCGTDLDPGKWHAHHLIPIADGGTDAYENLRVVCLACHKEIHR